MSAEEYRVATEVAFVTTADGSVRLGQGDPLPEGVSDDEIARLANGGVLEGYEPVPSLLGGGVIGDDGEETVVVDEELLAGNIGAIQTRIGSDHIAAKAYLDAELASAKPRPTLVSHLEKVVAEGDTEKVASADVMAAEADGEDA